MLPANYQIEKITCAVVLFMVLQIIFPWGSNAQGNLLLMPRRIVFEGAKKYEEINLANTGRDTARYVISLMHVRMKEDGSFEEVTEPGAGENFADKYIRFFPHSVVLGPDESQVVKIQLNRTNELTAGEYRSHHLFQGDTQRCSIGRNTAGKRFGYIY